MALLCKLENAPLNSLTLWQRVLKESRVNERDADNSALYYHIYYSTMDEPDSQTIVQETPPDNVFIAPSIHERELLAGISYTHHSAIPEEIANDTTIECVLGVDEAGRGPVLGELPFMPRRSRLKLTINSQVPWYMACYICLL